ncbi:MAG: hypothetical protein IPO91_25680 [Chloroflexi bacterium]|nr:hypothetical protein [Chloroflexota bacterium]
MSGSQGVVSAEDSPGTMIKRVFHIAKILAVVTNIHEIEREPAKNCVKNQGALDLRYCEAEATVAQPK